MARMTTAQWIHEEYGSRYAAQDQARERAHFIRNEHGCIAYHFGDSSMYWCEDREEFINPFEGDE